MSNSSRERVFHRSPKSSHNEVLFLSRNARAHLAETNGLIGAGGGRPLVVKLHNLHVQDVESYAQQPQSTSTQPLAEGDVYWIENPDPNTIDKNRNNWAISVVHNH